MFHRPSFSPVSFSRISFNGATQPVEQSGRSGYWRLFYHQLQEESLKKQEPKKLKTYKSPYKYLEHSDGSVTAKSTETTPDKPLVTKPKPLVAAIAQKPLPTPKEQTTNFIAESHRVANEVRALLIQYQQFSVRYTYLPDDEDDIELLLLFS